MLKKIGIFIGVAIVVLVVVYGLFRLVIRPWYLRWGATQAELESSLRGDELLKQAAIVQTNAITIHAAPEAVWPWIAQLGQDRGGFYSLEALENMAGCDIHNVDSIHPEWQVVKAGDLVRMYPKDKNGPPPYIVAEAVPGQALILGHHPGATLTGETWTDTWQFILQPLEGGQTRLVIRTRTNNVGGIWDIVEPVSFVMQYTMMHNIKTLAEKG
jgi:hypothetical protein